MIQPGTPVYVLYKTAMSITSGCYACNGLGSIFTRSGEVRVCTDCNGSTQTLRYGGSVVTKIKYDTIKEVKETSRGVYHYKIDDDSTYFTPSRQIYEDKDEAYAALQDALLTIKEEHML